MLYNESTGMPKADVLSTASLIEWLEQKPADGSYDYMKPYSCLLAQYFREKGFDGVYVGPGYFVCGERFFRGDKLPEGWEGIAVGESSFITRVTRGRSAEWTYGKALERAKALEAA